MIGSGWNFLHCLLLHLGSLWWTVRVFKAVLFQVSEASRQSSENFQKHLCDTGCFPGCRLSGHQFPNDSFKGQSVRRLLLESHLGIVGPYFKNTIFHSHYQSLSSSNTKKSLWNFRIRKDSLWVALFSWITTCTQVPVSDNEKHSSSSLIFLYVWYFFLHCLHLLGYIYISK